MGHLTRLFSVVALMAGVAAASAADRDPVHRGITARQGTSLRQGTVAFAQGNYLLAARLLAPAAERGNARAAAMLGFMYEHGYGVPQSYDVAVGHYTEAAERGEPSGQYLLGLMYDKGHGVDLDDVLAYKWLNLAAARAQPRERDYYVRIRDAVATKLDATQLAQAQWLATSWMPKRVR